MMEALEVGEKFSLQFQFKKVRKVFLHLLRSKEESSSGK